jgi:hypothetical protein
MRSMAVGAVERTFEDELALAMLRAARLRAAACSIARGDVGPRRAAEPAAASDDRRAGGPAGDMTDSGRIGRRF